MRNSTSSFQNRMTRRPSPVELARAFGIVCAALCVLAAVELDDEPCFTAGEADVPRPDPLLPTELPSEQATVAQMEPEALLGVGRRTAKLPFALPVLRAAHGRIVP